MNEKRTHKMRVIPEPAPKTRSVLMPGFKGAALKSDGPLDFTCGQCGITLLESMERNQVQLIVIRCGGCGAFNEIEAEHQGH